MKKYLSVLLAATILVAFTPVPGLFGGSPAGLCQVFASGVSSTASDTDEADEKQQISSEKKGINFSAYWQKNADNPKMDTLITLSGNQAGGVNLLPGKENGSVVLKKGSSITWRVHVPQTGLYPIGLTYRAADTTTAPIKVGVQLNGKTPFDESKYISLNRVFQDAGPISKDTAGNDMVPLQQEANVFSTAYLDKVDNYQADRFYYALSAGENTITVLGVQASVEIKALLVGIEKTPDYATYLSTLPSSASKASDVHQMVLQQAELAFLKSDSTLIAENDSSNPAISPSDPKLVKLNVIGGDNWSTRGQWIRWTVQVPKDGMYQIAFKYKQATLRGLDVSRRLRLDDKVLFGEMEQLLFPYSKDWGYMTVGDGKTPIWLTAGTHQLQLEIGSSPMNAALSDLEDALSQMNALYRKIIMITGTSPDLYNDYFLHRQIPQLQNSLKTIAKTLKHAAQKIESTTGTTGSEASSIYEIVTQLESFANKPNTIPSRLDRYKSNISTLADLLLRFRESPLRLDTIVFTSGKQVKPATKAGFAEMVWFRFQTFLASFSTNYSQIGSQNSGEGKQLKVWACTSTVDSGADIGRDQMRILKRLIDNQFTKKTGVAVSLSLIASADVLQQAVVGNQQPDVAMFVPKGTPVNLAYRDAIVNLSTLPDFPDWKTRVSPASLIPYTCEGSVYAMPDTQIFSMLFYRKDIFEQLGLEPPKTWQEVYEVAAQLQQNNLEAGVNSDENTFYMLMQQAGLPIYQNDLSKVAFDNSGAVSVFRSWTDLYTLYGIPVSFDFFNRFRTGEMSMGIMSMSLFNKLSAAAPEIDGLWSVAPVPGTMRDGVLHRDQITTSTASVILAKSTLQNEATTYLDWWSSADVQTQYGNTVESMMGMTGRYYSANLQTQEQVIWPDTFASAIAQSRVDFTDVPQTLATYYLSRNINNAFRKVVYNNANPRETLYNYTREINDELTRKRSDFHLNAKE